MFGARFKHYCGFAIVLLFSFLEMGCETVSQKITAHKIYERDLTLSVNGISQEGAFVIPKASRYTFKVQSKSQIDLMVLKSCSREIKIPAQRKSGIFGRNRAIDFDYIPNSVEAESSCPIELFALNEDAKNAFAFIAINDTDKYKLSTFLNCNGDQQVTQGVSVCQARTGLHQELDFGVDIYVPTPQEQCRGAVVNGKKLSIKINSGFCIYIISSKKDPKQRHKLYTIGYDDFLVKGLPQ